MPVVGKDIAHDSAVGHVSGESIFLDDLAPLDGELLAGIVPSPFAHGRLRKVDKSAALAVPDVMAVLTHRDIPGHNFFGASARDERLLVEDEAVFLGQPVALIAAQNAEALEKARQSMIVEMDELPPIFTIDQAIAANSYLGEPHMLGRGDVEAGLTASQHRLDGVLEMGGQEHFYLESMIAIAVPGEGGTMTIHSSTQHPSEVQMMVAEVLGVPFNHVVVICKRMGGGFGGKETQAAQPAMMAAALAAHTRKPVRFVYNKDDDMRFTGKRHPFKSVYRVGFDSDGRITALDLQIYSNGGCSTDLSHAVMDRCMLHIDNAYFLPAVRAVGRVCKTNLPSNTAFRGFGGPQGVATMENIIEEIALSLRRDALDVRQVNCYGVEQRNQTPYGQTVRNNMLPELFAALRHECEYDQRRGQIESFNSRSATRLRGLAVSAVKFGISFTRKTMNQANALVNIYEDGSVLVSTGATEMGQGVNTRVRQVVADALGVGYDGVLITATATDKNNNTSPTAASSGTDLNGAAALDACERLRGRLAEVAASLLGSEPQYIQFESDRVFDQRNPARQLPFAKVVCEGYERRVSLGERGFYATPGIDFDRQTGRGTPFLYFTNGVAAAEVSIDRFTGEYKIPRTDLIMDIGRSINPGIDRGQTVGAFIQGIGWVTTEELVYGPKGQLLSCSPTTYKIPNASDLPEIFNVRFLDNPHNEVSLHRSKAVGEPPLLLGVCVWLAIKNALSYVNGGQIPKLSLPATGERVLLAMEQLRTGKRDAVLAGI
jgi:xanthine dehydrogenase large subunit